MPRVAVRRRRVSEGAGGVGLAGAGGHLDERAGTVGGEGFFERGDGLNLTRAEIGRGQRISRGQRGEAGAKRVGLDVPRPVLLGNVRGRLAALVSERAPLYAEVARITVDTDGLEPAAVADLVISGLGLVALDG